MTDPALDAWTLPALKEHMESLVNGAEARLHNDIRALDQKTTNASNESKQLARDHNDLIRQMRERDANYAEKAEVLDAKARADELVMREAQTTDGRFKRIETWQSRINGAILVLGALGVANLVRIFAG